MASSSLPASLFLLSVVFWQFVAAADQNISTVKAEPGNNVILPCEDPDQGEITFAEWNRTKLGKEYVVRYRNFQFDPANQHRSYKDRVDLLVGQIAKGDVSLILKNTTTDDSGTYECQVAKKNREKKLISTVSLVVAPPPPPPEPFPVWVIVLLVLLVLLGLAAAALYFLFHWSPVQQVEVEPGVESVLLPLNVPRCLWFCKYRIFLSVDKVEWKDGDNKTVHVYQNGSDQPGEQNQIYRTRTKMDKNLLKTGDFSLTLLRPRYGDSKIFTCRVYNRKGDELMKKDIWLKFKVPEQVVVESGVESVLLPWTITESLDKADKVEWTDRHNRTVHVYQNGSDQPGEQNQINRTRTKMDENLLKTGDLSLTLKCPTFRDTGRYTCRVYNRNGDELMRKQVSLKVEGHQVEVKSGVESVLLPCRTRKSLDGDVKVEWKDEDNRTVHVYQNGSDQPGEQDQNYRTRTKMDENLLKTGDLSLTLKRPTDEDAGTYTCRVYNRDELMRKQVSLQVIAPKVEVESGKESVLLPCRTTESLDGDVKVEWMDQHHRKVHVYQNSSDQSGEQNQNYRTRTKMDENLLENKNLSLTLKRPTFGDTGTYTCRVYRDGVMLIKKQVNLQVKVPEPVEVESGVESVLLPWTITESLDGDVKVEWKDKDDRKVHVYQNGSDQSGEQNQIYRTRTRMDENLLKTKNLSLTLKRPRDEDAGTYTCSVYNRDGDMLMRKQVSLQVKVPEQVVVESGVESVLLPWTITERLDGDVKVEWKDGYNRTVHVYQNGSDQPGEQNQIYKDRTEMDENPLRTGDLSLTLKRPRDEDAGTYTCSVYNRDKYELMVKDVLLWVKEPVEVESGVESVLLPWKTEERLDGGVKVEWKDEDNRTVHVYQNSSDQPGEQNQNYRTRTKMDGNLLKTGDLSLTLKRPNDEDRGIYTCRVYNRDGDMLMMKQVSLKVKGRFQVQPETPNQRTPGPEDTRTRSNSIDLPLMGDQLV